MEQRQNREMRCHIVRQFVKNISDDIERMVCFMYMLNASDFDVCKQLKMNQYRLDAIKLKLAFELKKAGIRT